MQNQTLIFQKIESLNSQALAAIQVGKEQEALAYWGQILAVAPEHIPTLTAIGKHTQRKGEMKSALTAFRRVIDIDGKNPQHWLNLALVYHDMRDFDAEELAVQQALIADPLDLLALIMRAELLKRTANKHELAAAYDAVIKVAPPLDRLHSNLRPAVLHAIEQKRIYDEEHGVFLDRYLEPLYRGHSSEKLNRFQDSVDILLGRKQRFDSQSLTYHYPGLASIEFFERADFSWLNAFEAATNDIRDEFLRVLDSEENFTPYITYPAHLPTNQFAELNNSPRWSAFHLYKNGNLIEENAAKCPVTMRLLKNVPQPLLPGRTPAAMFSVLKAQTHIPPHTGVSNVRLVVHIPLIVPDKCGFRVGNQTREWELGKAMIFDDTIEHEAWNNSDKLRVVLIFDIWHPHLSLAEQEMITAMSHGLNTFKNS